MTVLFANTAETNTIGSVRTLAAGDTLIVGPGGLLVGLGEDDAAIALARAGIVRILGQVLAADGFGILSTDGANAVAITTGAGVFGAARGILLRGEVNSIDIAGEVAGGDYGLHVAALQPFADSRNGVTVGETGRVSATGRAVEGTLGVGVFLSGAGSHLDNAGEIFSRGTAVSLENPSPFDPSDGGLRLGNTGRITSGERTGVASFGLGRVSIANDGDIAGALHALDLAAQVMDVINDGSLRADTGAAVLLAGAGGAYSARVVNTGDIQSANGSAIEAAAGALAIEIVNAGTILGGVRLRDGNNLYDGRRGLAEGTVEGGSGADTLLGGRFADALAGGAGDDRLEGGAGDDTLRGGLGADQLDGGDGIDTVDYAASPDAVRINLARGDATGAPTDGFAEVGSDQASGDQLSSIERLRGSAFADTLIGAGGAETLSGGDGDDAVIGGAGRDRLLGEGGRDDLRGQRDQDTLLGGEGDDTLSGGAQSDTLIGGAGADTLIGGHGRDLFLYTAPDMGDLILDFTAGDRIDISALAPSAGGWFLIGSDNFSGQGREIRVLTAAGVTTLQADADGDGAAEVSITLLGQPLLGIDDLVL